MDLIRSLRSMPAALLGLIAVFLAVPVFSAFLVETPWGAWRDSGWFKAGLIALAYWALPLLICLSLAWKHFWFLPLYLVQCGLLTVHTILVNAAQPAEIQMARLLLIGLMIYVGFLLGNRNFLYPLLTKDFRLWRKSTRFRVGRSVYIVKDEQKVPALLQDISSTGLQVSVHPHDLAPWLGETQRGASFTVLVPAEEADREFSLPLEVMWTAEADHGNRRFGCRATDRALMKEYVRSERSKSRLPVQLPKTGKFPLEEDIQETALVLWLVCIALSFALPALGLW